MCDPHQLAPSVAFFHLTVDQPSCHLPPEHISPSLTHLEPLTKVSRERIEIEIKPVTGKERKESRGQSLSERVDEPMGDSLGAGAELKHGQNLGARIESQPEPEHLTGTAQPGANFIQLQMREVQVAEGALMEEREPGLPARVSHLVIVACRKPKTRSEADGSSPSASAESTTATRHGKGFSTGRAECRVER